MMYTLDFKDRAKEDAKRLKKSGDKQAWKKFETLLEELEIHPETGTGRPERLRYQEGNKWSRRISEKHRMVYEIFEHTVTVEIIQTYGHYDDK
ncbi:MAG: Txe/YoeB family addiction module toxin [Bacteroidales bacterium]|nr:Txe/YoeB family addiction module toxin [Bacteroidales bacterium]